MSVMSDNAKLSEAVHQAAWIPVVQALAMCDAHAEFTDRARSERDALQGLADRQAERIHVLEANLKQAAADRDAMARQRDVLVEENIRMQRNLEAIRFAARQDVAVSSITGAPAGDQP